MRSVLLWSWTYSPFEITKALPTKIPLTRSIKDVACGSNFIAFLTEEGDLYLWVNSGAGLSDSPRRYAGGIDGMTAQDSVLVIRFLGGQYAQLNVNSEEAPAPLSLPVAISQVSVCKNALVALTDDGQLHLMGENHHIGQAFVQGPDSKILPLNEHVTCVATGRRSAALVTASGAVYTWGLNTRGQLGLGDFRSRAKPTKVEIDDVSHIAMDHAAIATAPSGCWAWGCRGWTRPKYLGFKGNVVMKNDLLALSVNRGAAVRFHSLHSVPAKCISWEVLPRSAGVFQSVAIGNHVVLCIFNSLVEEATPSTQIPDAILDHLRTYMTSESLPAASPSPPTAGDALMTWSLLGGLFNTSDTVAKPVERIRLLAEKDGKVVMASKSDLYIWEVSPTVPPQRFHSCACTLQDLALTSDTIVFLHSFSILEVWSLNNSPVKLAQFTVNGRVTHLATGNLHTLVVCHAGTLYGFGDNSKGQLRPLGNDSCFPEPTSLNLHKAKMAACGSNHSLLLLDCGKVYSWGTNDRGQLGTGDRRSRSRVTEIVTLSYQRCRCVAVAAQCEVSAILTVEREVYIWGNERCFPSRIDVEGIPVSVSVASETVLVERQDGTYIVRYASGPWKQVPCCGGVVRLSEKRLMAFGPAVGRDLVSADTLLCALPAPVRPLEMVDVEGEDMLVATEGNSESGTPRDARCSPSRSSADLHQLEIQLASLDLKSAESLDEESDDSEQLLQSNAPCPALFQPAFPFSVTEPEICPAPGAFPDSATMKTTCVQVLKQGMQDLHQLKGYQEERQRLHNEVDSLRKSLYEAKVEATNASLELEVLRDSSVQNSTATAEVSALERRVASLTEALERKSQLLETATSSLREEEREHTSTRNALTEALDECMELRSQVVEHCRVDEVSELEAAVAEITAQRDNERAARQALLEEQEGTMSQLREAKLGIEAVEDQLKDKESQFVTLEENHATEVNRLEKNEALLSAALGATNAKLVEVVAEIKTLKEQQSPDLRLQLAQAMERLSVTRASLELEENENKRLRLELRRHKVTLDSSEYRSAMADLTYLRSLVREPVSPVIMQRIMSTLLKTEEKREGTTTADVTPDISADALQQLKKPMPTQTQAQPRASPPVRSRPKASVRPRYTVVPRPHPRTRIGPMPGIPMDTRYSRRYNTRPPVRNKQPERPHPMPKACLASSTPVQQPLSHGLLLVREGVPCSRPRLSLDVPAVQPPRPHR
ncbi:MAG: hypothetical protein KVP17_002063 [Porospora cf. gigantea B]|uniref:uncharacterized protein n=1 Tax=Porospora cf. gigantea B TaxID=2853592 RepID=UPI003571F170|nr:MAG: hypothetical protein KVP17_002063 [Porospora cf. gigantea B]